jgi:hypothetical protein
MVDSPGEAATLDEEQRSVHQAVSHSTPYSVDVAKAEQEFNALARQLSRKSQEGIMPSGATTRAASDVEKGGNEGPFDLREYLTTSNDAQQQAGIKVWIVFHA